MWASVTLGIVLDWICLWLREWRTLLQFQAPAASEEVFGAGQVTPGTVVGGSLLPLQAPSILEPCVPTPELCPIWQSCLHSCHIASREAPESFSDKRLSVLLDIYCYLRTPFSVSLVSFVLHPLMDHTFGEVCFSCPLVKKCQGYLDQRFSNFLVPGSLYTLKKY